MNTRPLFFRILEYVCFALAAPALALYFIFQNGLFLGSFLFFAVAGLFLFERGNRYQTPSVQLNKPKRVGLLRANESPALKLLRRLYESIERGEGTFNPAKRFLGCVSFMLAVAFSVIGAMHLLGIIG